MKELILNYWTKVALDETHPVYQALQIHQDGVWDRPIKEERQPSGFENSNRNTKIRH